MEIKDRYDYIVCVPPGYNLSLDNEKYFKNASPLFIENFLRDAHKHLSKEGNIILYFKMSRLIKINKLARATHYKILKCIHLKNQSPGGIFLRLLYLKCFKINSVIMILKKY